MLYYNIILLFLLLLLYETTLQNIQIFPYMKYTLFKGKYIIQLKLTKMPLVTFTRSLSLNHTFLALSGIAFNEGTFIENTTLDVSDSETLFVSQMKDEFDVGDNTNLHINLMYYILNTYDDLFKEYVTSFPLAHVFPNYSESFIHQMQTQGIIEHAMFALSRRIDYKGKLYFGGIPQEELSHTPFQAKCNTKINDINWSCRLNAIYFDDKRYNVYVNKHYMRFSSNSYKILVPLDFYEYLKRSVFHEHLKSKRCLYYNNTLTKSYIECDCPTVKLLPNIKFVIDNVVYSIVMEDIFEFFDASQSGFEYCQFEIEVNENGDYFDLGALFLGFYNTVFDYEDNSIMFYSDKPFEIYKQNDVKEIIKVCYVILIIILLIDIVYNIIQSQKLKLTLT